MEQIYKGTGPEDNEPRFLVKCVGKRLVELDSSVAEVDVEQGMRVALMPKTYKVGVSFALEESFYLAIAHFY